MFRKLAMLAVLGTVWGSASALTAGDIAFTSFNADEDGWSLVSFVDIAANTTIYFTDNEWTGSAFNTGESYHQWVSGASTIAAGSVIRFSAIDKTTLSSSYGTLTRASVSGSTNYGTANSNETIYAYLGSSASAPTSFLTAVTNSDFATADGSLSGTGLVQGTSAIRLNANVPSATPDYAEYTGVRSGMSSFADYKSKVFDPTFWTVDTTNGSYASTVPNTTAFSITPVPEPSENAMLLCGLGLLVVIARRRLA